MENYDASNIQDNKNGDGIIRTKYQIRTRDRFGPKTNSAQKFNYLWLVIISSA